MNKTNLTGSYSYIDSMIPAISNSGIEVSHKARQRAYRMEILRNDLNSADDLYCLSSITRNVVDEHNQNLLKLLYNRFEYLGFAPKAIPHRVDMSFKEKVTFFCSNFMEYFDNNGGSDFIDQIRQQ